MAEIAAKSPRLAPEFQGHIAMLAFSALIAGSFSLGGLVANEIAPAALNAMRFLLAGVFLSVVVASQGAFTRKNFRAPWRFVILGGLFAFYFVTMFEALKTATPVSTAAVFTLTPVVSAGFAWLLLRQRLTRRMSLALLVGAIGAIWVIFRADLGALLRFQIGRGEMIYFWGMIAHALYTPLSRYLARGENPFAVTCGNFAAGFLILLAYGWRDILATDWFALPGIVWITLGYISFLAGSVTLTLLQFAVVRLPSAKVMAYTYLTPSWVILCEIALGHGAPTGYILTGVALTFVSLWMLLKSE